MICLYHCILKKRQQIFNFCTILSQSCCKEEPEKEELPMNLKVIEEDSPSDIPYLNTDEQWSIDKLLHQLQMKMKSKDAIYDEFNVRLIFLRAGTI